ncbi:hypothetical protein P7K49_032220, partial [Saguinus oedipus]
MGIKEAKLQGNSRVEVGLGWITGALEKKQEQEVWTMQKTKPQSQLWAVFISLLYHRMGKHLHHSEMHFNSTQSLLRLLHFRMVPQFT